MRLVSKIHDYYDGVIRTSVSDKTHTFVREQREIPVDMNNIPVGGRNTEREDNNYKYTVGSGVIGFCGKIYPFISVEKYNKLNYKSTINYYFTYDDFIKNKLPSKIYSKFKYSLYTEDNEKARKRWLDKGEVYSWWKKDLYSVHENKILKDCFINERIAYFVYTGETKTVNGKVHQLIRAYPVLNDYGFGRVKDAYTAFQEIEMFLTNELIKPDVISEEIQATITDELKAHSHGYDKWSFRKEPEGK